MIFIRFNPESAGVAKVEAYGIYTNQFPQNEPNVVFVEDNHTFPNHEEYAGKIGILYINPSTKEMWYEYVDRPLTTEEETQQMKTRLEATEQAVLHLILEGGGL